MFQPFKDDFSKPDWIRITIWYYITYPLFYVIQRLRAYGGFNTRGTCIHAWFQDMQVCEGSKYKPKKCQK